MSRDQDGLRIEENERDEERLKGRKAGEREDDAAEADAYDALLLAVWEDEGGRCLD